MHDRTAASVGFGVAGLALVASSLDWTPALAGFGVGSPAGAVLAGLALAAFAARRYGFAGRRAALIALAAMVLLAVVAVVALVGPVVAGGETPAMGVGLPVALALGLVGAAIAYADWLGLDRSALVPRASRLGTATAVGLGGLLVGNLVAAIPLLLFGDSLSSTTEFALLTVLFGVGLGVVAAYFLVTTDLGVDYLDVATPDRRGWAYTAGGVLAIFGLLVGLGLLSEALGVGGSESSVVTEARQNPEILLALVPLSYLVIATGEELLFRNVVQKHLRETYSATGAVLLGTAVFTVMHVPTYYSPDPVAMLSTLLRLFLLSLVLGVAYERTRNVVVPVLIHGTFDAVQFAVLYVSLTGGLGGIV